MSKKIISYLLILACISPLVVCVIAHTYFVNTLAIDGKKLQNLEDQADYLERENASLNLEQSKLATTSLISEKAKKMGMTSAEITFMNKDAFAFVGGE